MFSAQLFCLVDPGNALPDGCVADRKRIVLSLRLLLMVRCIAMATAHDMHLET